MGSGKSESVLSTDCPGRVGNSAKPLVVFDRRRRLESAERDQRRSVRELGLRAQTVCPDPGAECLAVRFTNTRTRLGTLVHAIVLAAVLSCDLRNPAAGHAARSGLPASGAAEVNGGFAQFINKKPLRVFGGSGDGTADGNTRCSAKIATNGLLVYLSAILLLVGGAGNVAFSRVACWP